MADSWTVNHFDAAACITAPEINRRMREVYDTTSDFPKSWSAWQRTQDKDDPTHYDSPMWIICGPDNDANKQALDNVEFPDGNPPSPAWDKCFEQIQTILGQFTKASIGAPGIAFDTAFTNGVSL